MQTLSRTLSLAANESAHVHVWLPSSGQPRASLQIIHGMAEHGGRYARLAQALTDAGLAVYAQDLPGHGLTAPAGELGHMGDEQGWARTLAAIRGVGQHIAREQDGVPHFVLGHSMGGYLLQHHVAEVLGGLRGIIYSGCSGDLGPLRPIGLALLSIEGLFIGKRSPSWLGEQLSFRDFNRRFAPTRTPFDWLSRDTAEVDKYVADPLCGFRCSSATWLELMRACGQLDDAQRLARIRKDLPVLMITGAEDAANQGEKGLRAIETRYRGAGINDLQLRIYPGARHELLNETCRDEVTAGLLEWLNVRL